MDGVPGLPRSFLVAAVPGTRLYVSSLLEAWETLPLVTALWNHNFLTLRPFGRTFFKLSCYDRTDRQPSKRGQQAFRERLLSLKELNVPVHIH